MRFKGLIFQLGLYLILLSPTLAFAQANSPWPMFRHDLKHTGRTQFTGPATPTVAWTFQANDGIVSSASIGEDGTIYVGAGWLYTGATDNNLYAFNPNGSLKWSFQGGNGFFSSPFVGPNNMIYITCLDGNIYAIEDQGTQAQEKWKTYLDWVFNLCSPILAPNGNIYVGAPSFKFFSIDPLNGDVNWSHFTGWCIISSPAVTDDGLIVVGSKDHNLYAYDEVLQQPAWAHPMGQFYDGHLVDSSPAIGEDGTIYVGTDPYGAFGTTPVVKTDNFWAINPDGTPKWFFETGNGVESSPALGADGTIYFGSYDEYLYALTDEGTKGTLKWKFKTNGPIDGSPTVDGDGVIYFGSRDNTIYALYPDGSVKWTFQAQDGFESSPTIDDRGYLYMGCFDGTFYAFGTDSPDVGVVSIDAPQKVLPGFSYTPEATLRNFRGAPTSSFNVLCEIKEGGATVYSDTVSASIPGGAEAKVAFNPWLTGLDHQAKYVITVTTQYAGDDNLANNGLSSPEIEINGFFANKAEISGASGGVVGFDLSAGAANANRGYWILGSVTGTSPGLPLPGGLVVLPLNFDLFTALVAEFYNSSIFMNFLGNTNGSGIAFASLDTLGPVPNTVGLTLNFAYGLFSPWDYASNPVSIEITP